MMGGGWGLFWDRWEVVGRSFGKMENEVNGSRGGRKLKFSKMSGSVFPALGDQNNTFLAYSRTSEVQFESAEPASMYDCGVHNMCCWSLHHGVHSTPVVHKTLG